MSSKIVLGIDFGTTKTMVAWVNPATGRAETIQLGNGRNFIPTTVYVEEGGTMRFGEEADDQASLNPMRYCRGFKMKIGSSNPVMMVMERGHRVFYTARQLTVAFLKHVKHLCEEQAVMQTVQEAVITRPVNFTPAQVEELRSAAEAAGFHKVTFVTEPEAAGYAFCRLIPSEAFQHNALIVDWGGGTLDMAVVSRHGENVSTHAEYTLGDDSMGGELFDVFLWSHVSSELARTSNIQLNMEPLEVRHHAKQRLRSEKEALSRTEQRKVFLVLSHGTSSLTVTRPAFETLIHDSVQKAAKHVRTLLSDVQQTSLQPELLLLVGGTAQIPYIQQTLSELTGLPTKKWHYSREAVALGAALWRAPKQQAAPVRTEESAQTDKQALLLPAKKQEVMLQISAEELNGDKYFHGLDGCARDYEKAAEYYTAGYMKKDWNCAYALMDCYDAGIGVPKSPEYAVAMAREMIAAGCPLGFVQLAVAAKEGIGMPLNIPQSEVYRQKAMQLCTAPIPGVSEVSRFKALWVLSSSFSDEEGMEKWGRELYRVERSPQRFGMMAVALVRSAGVHEAVAESRIAEAWEYIEKGVAHNDVLSWYLGGLLLQGDTPHHPADVERGLSWLRWAAQQYPSPYFLSTLILNETQDTTQAFERFWEAAHLGVSCIPSSQDLNCRISICKNSNPFDAFHYVYDENVLQHYWQNGKLDDLVDPTFFPQLIIRNLNSYSLSGVQIRICIPAQGVDKIVPCPVVLPAQEETLLSFVDLGITSFDAMFVEVLCGSRKSSIDFGDLGEIDVRFLATLGYNPPPLVMGWTKGFWGGFVLRIISTEGALHDVRVVKFNGHHTNLTYHIQAGQYVDISWSEMSDSEGLQENERFIVECAGYSPVIGQILTTEADSSSAGWETAAKIGAGLLAVAFGAS